jgi:hypothetical protein
VIGLLLFFLLLLLPPLRAEPLAPRPLALRLICGRFADFAVDDRFALLLAPFFADADLAGPRFAELLSVGRLLDFRADDCEPPRALLFLPPDFPRDFLARAAMIFLLGVGGERDVGA